MGVRLPPVSVSLKTQKEGGRGAERTGGAEAKGGTTGKGAEAERSAA